MFGKSKMSDLEKKAKLTALKDAHKMANDAMSGHLSGLKKVTVAADSKKGLEHGLQKAEELIGKEPESDDPYQTSSMREMSPESETDELDPMEAEESMDEEDLDARIAHLLELKKKLQTGEE